MPGDQLTHAQRQKVYGNLAGYDVDDQMVKLSKVNLFLHGFPDPAIHIYDTLSNDARWHEKADLILANPPFMTPKGGVTPHTKFRIAAKKAEVLFTDYIAEHLTGDGRGGVIVPNGIVATTQNAYVKLRRFLVEDSLVAVVSLPAGVFKPYSGVKTSILLLDKKLARQTKEILFLKITADGFDLGDKRNPIEANDLPEAERVVKMWLKGKLNDELRMTSATGAIGSTKGATPSQPGATPQETNTANQLKGQRPAPSHRPNERAADETGLQPLEMFLNDAPGALPQAGMGSAVGAGVVWKRVEKKALLEMSSVSLQAEAFLGNGSTSTEVETVSLGEVATFEYGHTATAADEGDIRYVRITDINEFGRLRPNDAKFIKLDKEAKACLACKGDILVARIGATAGKTLLFDSNEPAVFASYLIRIRFDPQKVLPEFYWCFAQSKQYWQQRDQLVSGGGQPQFNANALKQLEIPLPPLEEQRRIVAEIEGYQKVIARLESEIAANLERIQTTIDAVWTGDSESANGAPPSQPGATPQVTHRKPTKG